jgi:hypothetical protein
MEEVIASTDVVRTSDSLILRLCSGYRQLADQLLSLNRARSEFGTNLMAIGARRGDDLAHSTVDALEYFLFAHLFEDAKPL